MNTNLLLVFTFFTLPLLFHIANADPYNITEVIARDVRFTAFNNYLTETGIAAKINSRQRITVLVVANPAMDLLKGKPIDVVKKIMSVHVLLSFYDIINLQGLPDSFGLPGPVNIPVLTLLKESMPDTGDQGILKISRFGISHIFFTSGPSGGSGRNVKSQVVNKVIDEPYFLSILEVDKLIIPPGIDAPLPPQGNVPAPPANNPAPPQEGVPSPKPEHPAPPANNPAPPQPEHPNVPAPPANNPAPPQPEHPNVPAPPANNPAPPKEGVPSQPGHPNVTTPPQPTNPAAPQPPPQENAPAQGNVPGSPQSAGSPPPFHAHAPGPHHHHANGSDPVEPPASAPEQSDGGSPAPSPSEKSYGVRIASSVSFNAVLAARFLVLAVLWMI